MWWSIGSSSCLRMNYLTNTYMNKLYSNYQSLKKNKILKDFFFLFIAHTSHRQNGSLRSINCWHFLVIIIFVGWLSTFDLLVLKLCHKANHGLQLASTFAIRHILYNRKQLISHTLSLPLTYTYTKGNCQLWKKRLNI